MSKKRKTDTVVDQEKARDEDAADLKAKQADKASTVEDDGSLEDKEYLKEYILACKKESEAGLSDIRNRQKALWDIYQNIQDYSKKEIWQSQIFVPKLFMAVERASLLIKRAILQVSKLFSMEHNPEAVDPIKRSIRLARRGIRAKTLELQKLQQSSSDQKQVEKVRMELLALKGGLEAAEHDFEDKQDDLSDDERRFKTHLEKTNFVSVYSDMIKSAILLGLGCIKRIWNNARKKLQFENVDVLNLFIYPDWQPFQDEPPKYIIEAIDIPLADLYELAQETNSNLEKEGAKSVFDIIALDQIKDDYANIEKSEQDKRRGLTNYQQVSKTVHLLQFWGKVISRDGRRSKKNQLLVLANDTHLIRQQDNPLPQGKPPYNLTIPIPYPHRGVAGISLVYAEAKLQYTLNNLLNLAIDNLNWSINKVFEYNPNDIKNPRDMLRLWPGKTIATNVNTQAIREVRVSPVGADAFKTYEVVGNEIREGTVITEFITGMPGERDKSLGEVQIKTSESHGYFDVIARDIELHSLSPTLRDSYEMLCQFRKDFSGDYVFKVGGLSLLLLARDQQEKLMGALKLAMSSPEIARRTKLDQLWKRLLDIWNQGDVFIEEDELVEVAPQEQQGTIPLQTPMPGVAGVRQLTGQQMTPEMRQQIQTKAAEDAKQAVARMNPQQILKMTA